jgi:cell pole-organizing protein PopZ
MEEILASIRRIIADEADPATSSAKAPPVPSSKPAAPAAPSAPAPAPAPKPAAAPAPAAGGKQDNIDAILAAAAAEEETQDEPDVLELTEPVKGFRQVNTEDVVFREEASEVRMQPSPAPQPRSAAATQAATASAASPPAHRPAPMISEQELLSPDSSAMVNAAFGSLAQTMLGRGRTLEDLVQEMMRPMLKQWLDENLPGLVERMVRAEIERVSRGR